MMPFHNKYPHRSCPICLGNERAFLFRQQFARMSDDDFLKGYDVVVCRSCGFSYADHLPEQDVFDAYYRKLSKYEYHDTQGKETAQDLKRFKSIFKMVSPHLCHTGAKILDIGCATGRLLSLFKEAGYSNVLGLDPSAQAAQTARNIYDIEVVNSTLANIVERQEGFDCILLSGVLEHIKDLSQSLIQIRDALNENALVFTEVPDAEGFQSRPDAPFQEFSSEHINFFTRISLGNLMRLNGFCPVQMVGNLRGQSASTEMPVVSAIFRKCSTVANPSFVYDGMAAKALGEYIEQSSLGEKQIHSTINRIIDERVPLIVWGVGTHTIRLLKTSRLKKADIRAFVDSNLNYQNRTLENIPIISPAELLSRHETILVSTRVFQKEIVRLITKELRLTNNIITLYELP